RVSCPSANRTAGSTDLMVRVSSVRSGASASSSSWRTMASRGATIVTPAACIRACNASIVNSCASRIEPPSCALRPPRQRGAASAAWVDLLSRPALCYGGSNGHKKQAGSRDREAQQGGDGGMTSRVPYAQRTDTQTCFGGFLPVADNTIHVAVAAFGQDNAGLPTNAFILHPL